MKTIMLTNGFPYIGGEKSLVRYEYDAIAKNNEVIIVAITSRYQRDKGIDKSIQLTEGTRILSIDSSLTPRDYLYALKALISITFWLEEINILLRHHKFIKATYNSLAFYTLAQKYKSSIKREIQDVLKEPVVVYSFWNTYYTLAFCMLSKSYKNIKIASRYHGYDLYDYRVEDVEYQPFKKWMNDRIGRKIFVSKEGYDYYLNKYPAEKDKSVVIHLGVEQCKGDHSANLDRSVFRIISCSRMIALKRINLIIEALSRIDNKYNIEWIHYGDGEEYGAISEMAKRILANSQNIRYELPGNVENNELLRIYSQDDIHCFISTSSNEGLPVSIMEAFANGIPAIATDVNGVSEAVIDHYNGILLTANPSVNDIVSAIEEIITMSEAAYSIMRDNAVTTWRELFDATKNAEELAVYLEGMN